MTRFLNQVRRFLAELRRRNVYQVAIAYLAAGFVVVELADIAAGTFDLPGWFGPMVWVVVGLGFPLAIVLAWALEVTPDGEVRVEEGKETIEERARARGSVRANLGSELWVGASILVILLLGAWWFLPSSSVEEASIEAEGPQVEERSIAVLPFKAHGQEGPGVFTEGMHDDLLTRLSNVSDLEVFSRTSVERYRDTELPLPAIADSLGVRWIVEGGVQEVGGQIQVNVQLIDPRSDTHTWADNYQRDLTAENLFAIQGEITREITGALEAELTAGEQERIAGAPTENLDAYRLYVQGRSALNTPTETGIREAVERFQKAIEQDSTYALAWSGLSDAIGLFEESWTGATPAQPLPDRRQAARRALELEPELAEARASMGSVYFGERNGPAAIRELSRAVELKPSFAQAHHRLGLTYYYLGYPDPAREHISLAVELNPGNWAARGALVMVLLGEGETEEARRHLDQLSADPDLFPALERDVLYHSGAWDELEQLARQGGGTDRFSDFLRAFYLARSAVLQGDTAAAQEQLAKIRREESSEERHMVEGLVQAALGAEEAAFEDWAEIEEWPAPLPMHFRHLYPDILDPLRADPRYEELIREANRAWGLTPDGRLPEEADASIEPQTDG